MSGVMRLILDREEGSARGDEDFFSVARTMPLVAMSGQLEAVLRRIGQAEATYP